ncbi:hypothetical protein B0T18DRAFT_163368 [Schizothecium vesticola]|uniref:Secreted protein n=1 Tax=Schizothecium vesticola TaxID=314040 RepID=A0AA40EWR6_9PEZI|nr:hypothetical protein B0T18DRAFT_163368 [Schizothecium vesticola]
MKFSPLLALPALAAAAALVERQAAANVQVISARSISDGSGSGCPSGHFGFTKDINNTTLTLQLDVYLTQLDRSQGKDQTNAFCDYEVTLRFPDGCTSGTVAVLPRGIIRLDRRFEAKFTSNYVLSPSTGSVTKSPAEIVYTSSNYGAPEGTFADFTNEHLVGVKVNVANGQRDYTFTARSRMFLTAPGISQSEIGIFDMQSLDIQTRNMVSC